MKKLSILGVMIVLSACANQSKLEETPPMDPSELSQVWQMDGRSPEWSGRINGRRYEASFPGLYENKMINWDVSEKDKVIYLNSKAGDINIVFTEKACSVANAQYTHSVTLKKGSTIFNGCARH